MLHLTTHQLAIIMPLIETLIGVCALFGAMSLWQRYLWRRARRLAPTVVEFALARFNLLDHDQDKHISREDLLWVQTNAPLDKPAKALVEHMLHELEGSRIGHYVPLEEHLRGPFPHEFGHEISRWDLLHYVDRLAGKQD